MGDRSCPENSLLLYLEILEMVFSLSSQQQTDTQERMKDGRPGLVTREEEVERREEEGI